MTSLAARAAASRTESQERYAMTRLEVKCGDTIATATQCLQQTTTPVRTLFFRRPSWADRRGNNARRPSEDGLQTLLSAMEGTDNDIDHVAMEPAFIDMFQHEASKIRFFRAVGGLPNLKHLHWFARDSYRRPGQSLQWMTHLLTTATSLKRIDCSGAGFAGSTEEFAAFADALRGHPSLTHIRFSGCRMAPGMQRSVCMDPVLVAMRSIPNLQCIGPSCWAPPLWDGTGEDFRSTVTALIDLCEHKALTDMTFHDVHLGSSTRFDPIFSILQNNRGLQNLSLKIMLQPQECTRLADIIRHNKSLRTLGLTIGNVGHDSCHDEQFIRIIEALKDNSTIISLTLICGFGHEQYVPSNTAGRAIVQMLETNMTLTRIHFFPQLGDCEFVPDMNYYLKLNSIGRKGLLQENIGRTQWFRTLAKAEDDVSCLFYLLSRNPALCDVMQRKRKAPDSESMERPAKKRRRMLHYRTLHLRR